MAVQRGSSHTNLDTSAKIWGWACSANEQREKAAAALSSLDAELGVGCFLLCGKLYY